MVRAGAFQLLFALLFAIAPVAARTPPPPPPGLVAVPLIRGRENHLLVAATLNGKPAMFLLDTGEEACFLQSDRASAYNVRPAGRQTRRAGQWFEIGEAAELRIGSQSFSTVDFALYDPAQFHGPVPGPHGKAADGIIGRQFLRRHKAIINCRTQQLYLQDGLASVPDIAATSRGLGFTQIAITADLDGAITVPCSIAGKPRQLALDTGAFVTVFDAASVRDFQLPETTTKLTARTPSGRVRPLQLAQFNDLRIGGVPIPPQKFAVMDLFEPLKPVRAFLGINKIQAYDERTVRVRRDIVGLLGSELLYQRSAIIDLGRMCLYLK